VLHKCEMSLALALVRVTSVGFCSSTWPRARGTNIHACVSKRLSCSRRFIVPAPGALEEAGPTKRCHTILVLYKGQTTVQYQCEASPRSSKTGEKFDGTPTWRQLVQLEHGTRRGHKKHINFPYFKYSSSLRLNIEILYDHFDKNNLLYRSWGMIDSLRNNYDPSQNDFFENHNAQNDFSYPSSKIDFLII
jgi:hypothetical protein